MKEIYLRVKVPDDFDLPVTSVIFEKDNMYFRAEKYVTEIQLPSEEEIKAKAMGTYIPEIRRRSFQSGATWMLNKMKGE